MDSDVITVNNFFGHWITDIDIRLYPDDTRILLTNNNVDVLKFPIEIFTKNSVATLLKSFRYSN